MNPVSLFRRRALVAALWLLGASAVFGQGRGGGGGGGGIGGGGAGGFGGGGAGAGATGTRQYPNSTLVGDALISSDVDTRELIVVADAATAEHIKAIIANLDKPKPQVLINVVFLQVTHDNSFDLGAEARYQGPISINTSQNLQGTATTRFGVAQQLATPSIYGAYYQLVGRDVSATIHALSQVTKTEILSRPSILTRSNQQATILVGQSIPLITNSTVNTNSNSITNSVTYQDVGIILRVTPFITDQGLVEMIVSPEISSLSATTVAVSDTVNSPVIDRRSADTVVVTPSDTTIVIGGLMAAQKNDTDHKVPVLGDIPILGHAFKRKVKSNVKTELLIFLTPHVVKNPNDLAGVASTEREKLKLVPNAFPKEEVERFIGQP